MNCRADCEHRASETRRRDINALSLIFICEVCREKTKQIMTPWDEYYFGITGPLSWERLCCFLDAIIIWLHVGPVCEKWANTGLKKTKKLEKESKTLVANVVPTASLACWLWHLEAELWISSTRQYIWMTSIWRVNHLNGKVILTTFPSLAALEVTTSGKVIDENVTKMAIFPLPWCIMPRFPQVNDTISSFFRFKCLLPRSKILPCLALSCCVLKFYSQIIFWLKLLVWIIHMNYPSDINLLTRSLSVTLKLTRLITEFE